MGNAMPEIRYTKAVRSDIVELSRYGLDQHGMDAVRHYNPLIHHTVQRLAENPHELGIKDAPAGLKMFHLRHFRKEISFEERFIKNPSHYLIFRVIDEQTLEIIRVLHEEVDLPRHLKNRE
jgi:toxin ParE1/3/4